MNAKILFFSICAWAIIYLLLHDLHDCNFKVIQAIDVKRVDCPQTRYWLVLFIIIVRYFSLKYRLLFVIQNIKLLSLSSDNMEVQMI